MQAIALDFPAMQTIPQWGTIPVIFVETSVFTRQIRELIADADYRRLQEWLIASPDAGALMRGSGGCRKLRWKSPDTGKRGGIRVIYYWISKDECMLMLLAYSKSRVDDLTPQQVQTLAALVKRELGRHRNG